MAKNKKNININLGTINEETMQKLSAYHVALVELKGLAEWYKEGKKALMEEKDTICEQRKEALDNGESIDTVAVKFDLVPVENKLRKLENDYKEAKKPHVEAQKKALSVLDKNLYYAYLLSSQNGDLYKKGSITIKKGKKSETIKIEKSFVDCVKSFLVAIGAGNADNESAIDKFARYMAVNTSGMQVANKGDDYAKEKREIQFNKLFMAVFFQYAIIQKNVIVVNEDCTLSMRDFSKKEEAQA